MSAVFKRTTSIFKVVGAHYLDPHVWFHLAECCLMAGQVMMMDGQVMMMMADQVMMMMTGQVRTIPSRVDCPSIIMLNTH